MFKNHCEEILNCVKTPPECAIRQRVCASSTRRRLKILYRFLVFLIAAPAAADSTQELSASRRFGVSGQILICDWQFRALLKKSGWRWCRLVVVVYSIGSVVLKLIEEVFLKLIRSSKLFTKISKKHLFGFWKNTVILGDLCELRMLYENSGKFAVHIGYSKTV